MKIAVIDSGCFNHTNLREHILYGKNFTSEGNSQNINDNNGHGTHIAGIIHNIIPDAKILVIKILDRYGCGYIDDLAAAIYYALENNADIINISINFKDEDEDQETEKAIQCAYQKNVPVICSAGNNGTVEYPAKYAISVGSLDSEGNISKFSSKDCDIYAIGEDVKSTFPNDSYEYMSGTSMATAKVTAYLAKKLQSNKDVFEFIKNNKFIRK